MWTFLLDNYIWSTEICVYDKISRPRMHHDNIRIERNARIIRMQMVEIVQP